METKLPSENYLPEDEYPELGAKPIEAAEPIIPEDTEEPDPAAGAAEAPSEPQTAPTAQQPAVPPQGAMPYMPYPFYPPTPGMPPYPQPMQQPAPPQGAYYGYPPYFMPYPPQQPMPPMPVQQPVIQSTPAVQEQPKPLPQTDNTDDRPIAVPESSDMKKPASTGTKAYLIILTALLVAMVAAFIVYVAVTANKEKSDSNDKKDNSFSSKDFSDDMFGEIPEEEENIELKHSEFEEKITLVADDGATQKRDTDNPDSVGKPDKDAKGVELKDEPKDKDDASKYTAKSSFNTLSDSVVTINCYKEKVTENIYDIVSGGSGTIISADGYVITNAHVLNNSKAYAVNVILNSGEQYPAKIIGYDTWTDLAVLKIDAKDLKPAEFADSEGVEVGDNVIAIGSPGGAKYQNSLTQGVVSAVDREISLNKCVRYIQSDAAISPGSSGGPLCNLCGQVIGITTAKTIAQYYENMCFSIPSTIVKDVVNDLIRYGYVPDRARIGFSGSEVTADDKLYYGIPSGVIIGEIADDGALAGTSIQKYDVVTAIDGEEIASFQDIYNILAKHKKGDKITLSIYRIEEDGFFDDFEKSE